VTAETLTLTDFLLARIAEDESTAGAFHSAACTHETLLRGSECLDSCGHPARVLAECEAKRVIVEGAQETLAAEGYGFPADDTGYDEAHSLARFTLRALAAVHADHPDYDESWRP